MSRSRITAHRARWRAHGSLRPSKTSRRPAEEGGFTLTELLVVIVVIFILAAIAAPSFLNQKSKSTDASAKDLVRSAQTAAETLATDTKGGYPTLSPTALNAVEATIPIARSSSNAWLSAAATLGGGTGFYVTSTSVSGNTFTIQNDAGVVTRSCTVASGGSSGGCVNSTW
jgi:type IV pilus assembly protein PilA